MRETGVAPERAHFDVYPKIVRAGESVMITIESLFEHVHVDPEGTYTLTQIPCRGLGPHASAEIGAEISRTHITFTHTFACEQEHVVRVEVKVPEKQKRRIGEFRVCFLECDLFAKQPLKGDFHMHSNASDGTECPAFVAAACRRIGLDFMALTDHRRYQPSLEAQQAFADVDMDLTIFPGEEIHPPDNPVHIVNFGGRASVNAMFGDQDDFKARISDYANALPSLPDGVDRYHDACCQPEGDLTFDHIIGDPTAGEKIQARKGAVPGLYAKHWA